MNMYSLCIKLCLVLITQTNTPQDDSSANFRWIYNGVYSVGKACTDRVGEACKFLVDHGKGQAALERLPELESEVNTLKKEKKESDEAHRKELRKQQRQTDKPQGDIVNASKPITLEQAAQIATIGGATVIVGGAAYSAGKAIRNHLHPTDEQKLHKERIAFELRKFRAQNAARECIARRRKTAKDSDDIPYLCRELFDEFVVVAAAQEIEEIKRISNI